MIYLVLFFLMKALRADGFGVDNNLWETVNILVLVIGCLHYAPVRFMKLYYTPLKKRGFLWFFFFLFLFTISLWRSNDFVSSSTGLLKDIITLLLLIALFYLYQQHRFVRQKPVSQPVLLALIHAIGIFCLLNVIAVILNPMYGQDNATTLAIVGFHTKKVLFSMYPEVHPNYVGMMGGFLFVMSLERSVFGPGFWNKVIRIAYLTAGMMVVLICDARTTFLAVLLSGLVVYGLQRIKKLSLVKYTVVLLPFSSVIFIVALQFAAGFSAVQSISRDSSDLATGNSRKFIYDAAARELSDFKPIHLVGYGEYGTYGSGLTRYYMKWFGYDDEEVILNASVAHNTALQVIFDVGYIGLLAYSLMIFFSLAYAYKLYQAGYTEYLALLSFFVFNIITGFTTSRFGNYHEVANQLFFVFCFLILSTYNYHSLEKKLPPSLRPASSDRFVRHTA